LKTTFTQLNDGWNAEPGAPYPSVEIDGRALRLSFLANAFQFPEYREGDRLQIEFQNCWRHRLGSTNDEGWYRGQCRFGRTIPWGEFYELGGELLEGKEFDWIETGDLGPESRHFLFYFKSGTFECDAESWRLSKLPSANQ